MKASGDGDEFHRAVAKTAVAQICESVGFQSIQKSALESLADIAIRYLSDIGKTSQFYANLACRTQSNALDVILALEDVGTVNGGSEIVRHASSSSSLKELMRFVSYSDETPFAKPVPRFPIAKKRASAPTFSQLGEKPPNSHIPSWLPAFPDPHTYKSTPIFNERRSDPRMDKLEHARQRRKAERSLVSLHLRLCTSGAASPLETTVAAFGTSPPSRHQPALGTISSEQEAVDGIQGKPKNRRPTSSFQNPFLAPPLPADAKDVSTLVFSGTNPHLPSSKKLIDGHVALPSVLEAFAPAVEAARQGLEQGGGVSKQSMALLPDPKDRMPVLFNWDFGRKASQRAAVAGLSLGARHSPPPGKDRRRGRVQSKEEEKDDKKRRAEQILAQSMEGTEDVA